jgi:hypothetical protein
MHAEVISGPTGPVFFWNVDGAVGRGGINRWDDVLFVSWCFYKFARLQQTPPDLRTLFMKVGLTTECDGSPTHPIVGAIEAVQKRYHLQPVDGRVSPAHGVTYIDHYNEFAYLIFRLNSVLRLAHPEHFPRIDMMPEFVWKLKKLATAPFV